MIGIYRKNPCSPKTCKSTAKESRRTIGMDIKKLQEHSLWIRVYFNHNLLVFSFPILLGTLHKRILNMILSLIYIILFLLRLQNDVFFCHVLINDVMLPPIVI